MEGCGPNAVEKGSGKEERIGIQIRRIHGAYFIPGKVLACLTRCLEVEVKKINQVRPL